MSDERAQFETGAGDPSPSSTLVYDGRVATVTFHRPEARNAFDRAMIRSVGAQLERVASSSADVIVLCGAGGTFCAGGDLRELATLNERGSAVATDHFRRLFGLLDLVEGLPQVVVASVEGVAAGFGLALVLRADLAVAARSARFGAPELASGIQPTSIASELIRVMSPSVGRSWLLRPHLRDAGEAWRAGILAELVDDDALPDATERLVTELAERSGAALRATKALYRQLERTSPQDRPAQVLDAAVAAFTDGALGSQLGRSFGAAHDERRS